MKFRNLALPILFLLLLGLMSISAITVNEKNERLDRKAAQIDSLMQVEDSLRTETQRLRRENRKLENAINGHVEKMGQAMTTETKRPEEMKAVAHVIVNRTKSDNFPATPSDVVLEPGAFSGMPVNGPIPAPSLDTARVIAKRALLERSRDPTSGSTHFFSPVSMRPKWSAPPWAYHYAEVSVEHIPTGRFKFYRTD